MWFLILIVVVVVIVLIVGGADSTTSSSTRSTTRHPSRSRTTSIPSGGPPSTAEAVEESERCWVPPGRSVRLGDYLIEDGMLYVGSGMRAVTGWGKADPALVVPDLRVNGRNPDRQGRNIHYWPSYSDVPSTARAAYLEWLAEGRRNPDAYIGYVFLFFYGLERRLLLDTQHSPQAKEEVPALVGEIEDLLEVYEENRSFHGYASRLLDLVSVTRGELDPESLDPPPGERGWDLPLRLKIGLGMKIAAHEPIPADWALSWARCDRSVNLRTPASRCRDAFDSLFKIRYGEEFGDGLVLKPNRSRLSVDYQAASSGFRGAISVDAPDLPDVGKLRKPVEQLGRIAEKVQDELDSYSRHVGRHEDRTSPRALALLPPELVPDRMGKEAAKLHDLLDEATGEFGVELIELTSLIAHFPSKHDEKLTKREAKLLAEFLVGLGFGMEPDPRYGGPNPSRTGSVAVFRLPDGDRPPSDSYVTATILLHLGAAVAGADGDITIEEETHLEEHLEEVLELAATERLRLRAHLRWLLAEPPNLRGLRRRVTELAEDLRHRIGQALIAVAGADGRVSAEELKVLAKIYPILGFEEGSLYEDVHSLTAEGPGLDRGPVTVLPSSDVTGGYQIPQAPEGAEPAAATLDQEKINAINRSSREATEVLGRIFAGEDAEEETEEVEPEAHDEDEGQEDLVAGLDPEHSSLLRLISERHQWEREEFGALAESHGLMAAGAIEIINDASFETCAEPLLEGSETIEVNPYALKEMLR